jgi:hypothetical protein
VVAPLLLPPPPIPQRPAAAVAPPSLLPSPALRAIRRRHEQNANWLDGEDDLLDEPHPKMVVFNKYHLKLQGSSNNDGDECGSISRCRGCETIFSCG